MAESSVMLARDVAPTNRAHYQPNPGNHPLPNLPYPPLIIGLVNEKLPRAIALGALGGAALGALWGWRTKGILKTAFATIIGTSVGVGAGVAIGTADIESSPILKNPEGYPSLIEEGSTTKKAEKFALQLLEELNRQKNGPSHPILCPLSRALMFYPIQHDGCTHPRSVDAVAMWKQMETQESNDPFFIHSCPSCQKDLSRYSFTLDSKTMHQVRSVVQDALHYCAKTPLHPHERMWEDFTHFLNRGTPEASEDSLMAKVRNQEPLPLEVARVTHDILTRYQQRIEAIHAAIHEEIRGQLDRSERGQR